MKTALQISFFVLCAAFCSMAYSQSQMASFSPPSQVLADGRYPRTNQVLFRGTSDAQMSLSDSILAMSGKPNSGLESLFFSTLKSALMDQDFSLAAPLTRYLQGEVQRIKTENGGALNEEQAFAATQSLVDATFDFLSGRNSIIPSYIDYESPSFIDWPTELVFTTVIPPLAATYGDRTVVVQEKTTRSLDLNFWNYRHNGIWYHHTRDAGEFVAFGYIPGSDILGYKVRSGSTKAWHRINLSVFRSQRSNNNSLLVFSGRRHSGEHSFCQTLNKSTSVFSHCRFRPGEIILQTPEIENESLSLVGFIEICKNKVCSSPKAEELRLYSTEKNDSIRQHVRAEVVKSLAEISGKDLSFSFTEVQ